MGPRTIFITATDTGAGKTVLTACLLHHLLQSGVDALAMKPFCSGGRADVDLLQAIQRSPWPDGEMNPFYFPEPVAPLVAARKRRRKISLGEVLEKVRAAQCRCRCLLVEGVGGLMVPLGEGYLVADLVQRLHCPVIVVAPNKLGSLNHTLLTVRALQERTKERIQVVLRGVAPPDLSARTNRRILAETLAPVRVLSFPFLGAGASQLERVKKSAKKMKKVLASLLG